MIPSRVSKTKDFFELEKAFNNFNFFDALRNLRALGNWIETIELDYYKLTCGLINLNPKLRFDFRVHDQITDIILV